MLEAIKKRKVYIQLIIYNTILIAGFVTTLVLYYSFGFDTNQYFNVNVAFLLAAVVMLAIGFIASDVSVMRYRHKSKNWAEKAPSEVKQHAWDLRTPWYISAAVALIFTVILDILMAAS